MNVPSGLRGWLLVAAVAVVAVGCHKKDDVVPPVAPTATPTAGVSATPTATPTATPSPTATIAPTTTGTMTTVVPAGGSITLSSGTGGLAGSLVYAASTSGTGDPANATLTTTIPILASPPPGTNLAAFELQLNTAWTFANGLYVSPFVLPSGYPTTGLSFYEYIYDTTSGLQVGSPLGPVTSTGDSLMFAAPSPVTAFSANALDTYAVILTAATAGSSSTGTPVKY
jgi:hypothetical protein